MFDLDDTLLNSSKMISDANIDAINSCKRAGHIIGYITARSSRKIESFIINLPCDCMALYNGAMLYTDNVLLESNIIPRDDGIALLRKIMMEHPKTKIGVYLEPYSYFEGELRNIATGAVCRTKLTDLPDNNIQRIRIVFDSGDTFSLDGYISENESYFLSAHGSAIIVNKQACKENSLGKLSEYFKIQISDVIAFGDDINDIDMIKIAGTGIAMGNAIEDVKRVADFITETNDNDGIAKWLNVNLL